MKRLTILVTLMVMCLTTLFAQAPEKFTYQAVVRNSSGQLMASTNVGIRVSILQGSSSGGSVYVETQTVATNANGLITLSIGDGNAQQGSFADIEWANGSFFLKTEIDPNGGSNYSITSTQQLMSVPYALYAKEAGNSSQVPTNVSAFTNDAGYITSADIPEIPTVPTNVSAFTNDAGYLTNAGCDGVSLCDMYDTLSSLNGTVAALRDTIAQLQATIEAISNPYVENTPMVTTTVVSYITQTSAYCGGIVTSMSNDPVTARGICWSTNLQPTLTDNYTNDGAGVGSFTGLMSGLTPNTTYYARAYATNSLGTAYGMAVSFTTNDETAVAELPTVITSPVTNIIQNHANCGGMVTADGGAPVTARGVCWSTTVNPSITGMHSTDGSGLGEFTSNIAGLAVNTTYYVCAYATNSAGTAYGEVLTITPGVSCPGTPTVTDYDGNTYNTVQIGTQCWMKENLKTTHYSNGVNIPLGNGLLGSTTNGYFYYPNNETTNKSLYGLLYNWAAVMNGADTTNLIPSGVQGVCPTGWHVPSDNEFVVLVDYLHDNSEYLCGTNQNYLAKSLADSIGWRWTSSDSSQYQYQAGFSCFVGNHQSMNNSTSFSARPAGRAYAGTESWATNTTYSGYSEYTYFWTTTSMSYISSSYTTNRSTYGLYFASAEIETPYYLNSSRLYGLSVRCLKD